LDERISSLNLDEAVALNRVQADGRFRRCVFEPNEDAAANVTRDSIHTIESIGSQHGRCNVGPDLTGQVSKGCFSGENPLPQSHSRPDDFWRLLDNPFPNIGPSQLVTKHR
jgi:hypothetical protein